MNWYEAFKKEEEQAKAIDYSRLISQRDSISDGINHLPIPSLYRTMIAQCLFNSDRFNGYTQSAGHPLLVYGIQYYERFLANVPKGYADHICITVGATAAIQMIIQYLFAIQKTKEILLAGMSYYLFEKIAVQSKIEIHTILPTKGCFPTSRQLCDEISKKSHSLVVLTQPSNPSGELYSESDLAEVIKECRNHNSILLLDICQLDEILEEENFLNYGKIIAKEKASDYVIIVNSLSKTRSLAGARIGYVITNDIHLHNYICYCNELLYFNHPLGYEYPLMMDLAYRMVLRTDKKNLSKLIESTSE